MSSSISTDSIAEWFAILRWHAETVARLIETAEHDDRQDRSAIALKQLRDHLTRMGVVVMQIDILTSEPPP